MERAGASSLGGGPSVGPGGVKKGFSGKSKMKRIGSMNPTSDNKDPDTKTIHGEADIDGAKVLSVINIKVRSIVIFGILFSLSHECLIV